MAGVITVRPARTEDLPALYRELERGDREKVDLRQAIVHVVEDDDGLAGFVAARLIWQVEPLIVFERVSWPGARRRAARLLAGAVDGYLRSAGLGGYYAFIRDRVFRRLARRFGMRRVYAAHETFRREY